MNLTSDTVVGAAAVAALLVLVALVVQAIANRRPWYVVLCDALVARLDAASDAGAGHIVRSAIAAERGQEAALWFGVREARREETEAAAAAVVEEAKLRAAHPQLLKYRGLLLVLSVLAIISFLISWVLDRSTLETLQVTPLQALLIGTAAAVATAALGIAFWELCLSDAAVLRHNPILRVGILVAIAVLALAIVAEIGALAPRRAAATYGPVVTQADTACTAAHGDPNASQAQVEELCAEADRLHADEDAAAAFDTLVSVVAPVSEFLTSVGLVGLLELWGVARLGRRARTLREGRAAIEAAAVARYSLWRAALLEAVGRCGKAQVVAAIVEREAAPERMLPADAQAIVAPTPLHEAPPAADAAEPEEPAEPAA